MDILNEILDFAYKAKYLIAGLVLITAIVLWWENIKYLLFKFWVWFPVFGIVARSSGSNHYQVVFNENKKWFRSQEALCARFYAYYSKLNKDANFYNKCADYLNKVDERGRKQKSLGLWLGTIILVLLEAYIFSLVLVPFMDNRVSSNQAVFAAWGLAIMIAVILVAVTHMMGFELHKNTLLNKARAWYANARHNQNAKSLSTDSKIDLDNTYKDDSDPQYIQLINRIPHNDKVKGSYAMTSIAVILIITFAVGAYWIRSLTINELETVMVNGGAFSESFSEGGNGSIFDLPDEAIADARKADETASSEIISSRIQAYKTTFLILSVIFVGIQIVGVMVGFFRSFAGKQSKDAAKYIGSFNSAKEFEDYYEMKKSQLSSEAQAALQALTQKIELRHELSGTNDSSSSTFITFDDYVLERLKKTHKTRFEADQASQLYKPVKNSDQDVGNQVSVNKTIEKESRETNANADVVVRDTINSNSDELILAIGDLDQYDDESLLEIANEVGCSVQQLRLKHALLKHRAKKHEVA